MEAPGGVVRSDGESGAIGRGGLVQPLQITQRAAEIEEGADMIGPQLGGAAVGGDGARRLSQVLQRDAQVVRRPRHSRASGEALTHRPRRLRGGGPPHAAGCRD